MGGEGWEVDYHVIHPPVYNKTCGGRNIGNEGAPRRNRVAFQGAIWGKLLEQILGISMYSRLTLAPLLTYFTH